MSTQHLLEEYVAWLWSSFAETTARCEVPHIKAAYGYAVRTGVIDTTPATNLECPRVSEVEPSVFSNDELRLIRAAIKDDLEEMVFYGLAYGVSGDTNVVDLDDEGQDDVIFFCPARALARIRNTNSCHFGERYV